jgi:hypothetical protein
VARSICTYRTGCVEAHTLGTCDLGTCGFRQRQPTSTPQEDDHQDRRSIVLAPPSNRHMHILHNIYPLPASTTHIPQHHTPPPSPRSHNTKPGHMTYLTSLTRLSLPPSTVAQHGRQGPRESLCTCHVCQKVAMRRWRKKSVYGNGVLGKGDLFLGWGLE